MSAIEAVKPLAPLIATSYYAPPDKCWSGSGTEGVPCAPVPQPVGTSLGDFSNPDMLWWPLGGMRVDTDDKPEKIFWPLGGETADGKKPWSELAEQSPTHIMQYVPCSCHLPGTCKFYEAVAGSDGMYEAEEDELLLSKAAMHLQGQNTATEMGCSPANVLAYVAPDFDSRFGGAYIEHGDTAWQGLTAAESVEVNALPAADAEKEVKEKCWHKKRVRERSEQEQKTMPDFLCMREPISPWRPIVQPISHPTRSGGCALNLLDIEGKDEGANRFCLGREGQTCLWVYRSKLDDVQAVTAEAKLVDLTAQYEHALMLLRPSFGPTPEPQRYAAPKGDGTFAHWPYGDWDDFRIGVYNRGVGVNEDVPQKMADDKKASMPHTDAPFVGAQLVFQGVCRSVKPQSAGGDDATYQKVKPKLTEDFFAKLAEKGGAEPALPYCSPTSPDFEQLQLTIKSFAQSRDHYAEACKRVASQREGDEKAAGHACVMASGEPNPRPKVKAAFDQRLPQEVEVVEGK